MKPRYGLIIPALDEEETIGRLLAQIPPGLFEQVIVVDNGSRDRTAEASRAAGAKVIVEPRRGYGQACATGLRHLMAAVTAVAFMDGDLSDEVVDLQRLMEALERQDLDLVIGSRVLTVLDAGCLKPIQRFGNWLSTRLIAVLFKVHYSDLGPMRVIRREALERLSLRDRTFGWNVEMQARAAQLGLKTGELPVRSQPRQGGRSKISGTVSGSLKAGLKILWTIYFCWHSKPAAPRANV